MKLSIYSQTHTLGAGEQTEQINIMGNCILLSPVTVDGYTTEIAVKVDDSGFKKIPTGSKIELLPGETFKSVQFKNTSPGTSHTFHVLALRGSAANYNLQLNGDITVAEVTIDDSTPLKVEQQTSIEIDDSTPLKVEQQTSIEIDDSTPLKVEQQTSIDVVQNAELLALLTRIADATEGTETNTAP